jgi:AcrR family transcriptional regulator
VYRRFRDKDALMRAVFRRFNERSSSATDVAFDPETVRPIGLVQFSRNTIKGMVRGFRANAAISRAAVQYAERHPQLDFIRNARASEAKSFGRMVETFLMWRDEIRHPDPEFAIRFAFLVVACLLRELIIFDRMKMFSAVVAVDDAVLERELPRVFLRCLGAAEE